MKYLVTYSEPWMSGTSQVLEDMLLAQVVLKAKDGKEACALARELIPVFEEDLKRKACDRGEPLDGIDTEVCFTAKPIPDLEAKYAVIRKQLTVLKKGAPAGGRRIVQ